MADLKLAPDCKPEVCIETCASQFCESHGMELHELVSPYGYSLLRLRQEFLYLAVQTYGYSFAAVGRALGMSTGGVMGGADRYCAQHGLPRLRNLQRLPHDKRRVRDDRQFSWRGAQTFTVEPAWLDNIPDIVFAKKGDTDQN